MPDKEHILVVEDEPGLSETLKLNLGLEGYSCTVIPRGDEALSYFNEKHESIDLVLLDVMLPGINGFELCATFKKQAPGLPVIFLTAKNLITDKLTGLKLADDYLTKPFDLEELLLRIRNRLNLTARDRQESFAFKGGAVNFITYEITDIKGQTHALSRREIGLLSLLTSQPNKVVSRDEILEKLWDPEENASARTIDNYILNFRKFFESNPKEPRHFHSVRGVGYKFTP